MIAYSYKDVKIEIDGEGVYCSSANLSYAASFEPAFTLGDRSSFDNISIGPMAGSLSLTYMMTGLDPFARFQNEKVPFSVKMGGVTIDAGHLVSYSFDVSPYSPISASVDIKFYKKIEGDVMQPPEDIAKISNSIVPLNASDVTLNGGVVAKEGVLVDLSYSYNCDIEVSYRVDGTIDLAYGFQKVELQANINDYDVHLLPTGIRENFEINLNDKNKNTAQSFVINGQIATRDITASANDSAIYTAINIGQASLGVLDSERAVINDFTPKEGTRDSAVELQGNNFVNVDKILLGEFPCEISGDYTTTSLDFVVARDLPSGYKAPIHLITRGMRTSSHTGFWVTSGLLY